jgi:hypothetical protein
MFVLSCYIGCFLVTAIWAIPPHIILIVADDLVSTPYFKSCTQLIKIAEDAKTFWSGLNYCLGYISNNTGLGKTVISSPCVTTLTW